MSKKPSNQANLEVVAKTLRTLIDEQNWRGTITQLAEALQSADANCPYAPARLAIWLRQTETTLWWKHRIALTFSRTGKERLIHLSLRDGTAFERRCHQEIYGALPETYFASAHTSVADGNVGS